MVITENTLTATVLPFLTKEQFEKLVEQCDEVQLDKSIFAMTCGEFIESLDDEFIENIFHKTYLFEAIGQYKTYKREMEQLDKFLKLNEFKLTPEEEKAQVGIIFPTFPERILMTVTEYFHLKSFDEAENVPFSNYLMIIKAKNADSKYERNYQRIMEAKAKTKRK